MNNETTAGCAGCGRRDFIYGLLAAVAAGKASAHELGDFFAALPAPTPPGAIPDKTGAIKVRLVFAIWDDVQVRKTWPNVGFDFRPVMKNIADALNAGAPVLSGIAPGGTGSGSAAKKSASSRLDAAHPAVPAVAARSP